MAGGVAVKLSPKLWETAKEKACSEGGMCKHSARKMQWATQYYKKHGGKYGGSKSSSNRLHQWTKQKWRTADGSKSGGKKRYLPDKAWKSLSAGQIRRTNRAKLEGFKQGKQFVKQPKDVATIAAKARRLSSGSRTRSNSKRRRKSPSRSSVVRKLS